MVVGNESSFFLFFYLKHYPWSNETNNCILHCYWCHLSNFIAGCLYNTLFLLVQPNEDTFSTFYSLLEVSNFCFLTCCLPTLSITSSYQFQFGMTVICWSSWSPLIFLSTCSSLIWYYYQFNILINLCITLVIFVFIVMSSFWTQPFGQNPLFYG